ncbi:thioesterase II family protein [Geitlerinema calcuttense]|uniref:Thioesterase II family protein n=1 Tax=Geitlerinema calcuttense NRMC-F 0142 TaxID=2922238 RepID=A0ABT7M1P7_9CYAN|nr:thioesterase II family protein [Geitlerinema calcuttense]MDL5057570.1 thioesterase II family protein [Geitlerinema calcuttense NRMC-F 0142]
MFNVSSQSKSWITYPQPNPRAKLRLFCFHYAGGGAVSFRNWSDALPFEVEVCPIELPGRGARLFEQPFAQLQPLIEALSVALVPHCTKPFAFLGHSMGALVGFELARSLRRKGDRLPLYLLLSGHRAPQLPDLDPPLHALPDDQLLQELRRYNGTPEAVLQNAELMQLLLPTLRADFSVVETYRYQPEPPLDCPIFAFGGLQDWKVKPEDLEAWRQQTTQAFTLQMFPGDHFFLHAHQALVLRKISDLLEQVLG